MNLSEFIVIPPKGWRGRNRYIARQLLKAAWEGAFFVLFLIALLAIVTITYFAFDGPVPR